MTKNHHLLVYFVSTKHISHSSLKYLTSLETVLTLFLLPAIKNTVSNLLKKNNSEQVFWFPLTPIRTSVIAVYKSVRQ